MIHLTVYDITVVLHFKSNKMLRVPALQRVDRAYSERSPLNPTQIEEPRGISYGSLSPYFGFLRSSMWRPSSMQVNFNFETFLQSERGAVARHLFQFIDRLQMILYRNCESTDITWTRCT